MDPRIRTTKRALRAKKTFQFHKEGVFVKQDDRLQEKEQRKLLSGLTSGRNDNAYVKDGMGDDPAAQIKPAATHISKVHRMSGFFGEWWLTIAGCETDGG